MTDRELIQMLHSEISGLGERLESKLDKLTEKLDNDRVRIVALEERVTSIRGTFKYIGSLILAMTGSIVWMIVQIFTSGRGVGGGK